MLIYVGLNTAFSWLYNLALRESHPVFPTDGGSWVLLLLWPLIAAFCVYFLLLEALQAGHLPIESIISDQWNWLQAFSILFQLVLIVTFWRRPEPLSIEYDMTVNLLGLQNTLAYLRIIYFLKGFSSFGPLVRMIMQIIADVRPVRARTRSNATPLAAPTSQRSLRLLLREIAQATAARASRGASSRFRTRVPATPHLRSRRRPTGCCRGTGAERAGLRVGAR